MKETQLRIVGTAIFFIFIGLLTTWVFFTERVGDAELLVGGTPSPEILTNHTKEFKKEIIKVTEGIHLAIGYALANSILIEAPEGAIIVDTTECIEAAEEIYTAFRNITNSPIKVIVYTHNHQDHIYGTQAFIEAGVNPEIWAHERFFASFEETNTILPLIYQRATRQFGTLLKRVAPSAFRNAGIGPRLRVNKNSKVSIIVPTHLVKGEQKDISLAGLPVSLVHIPGETMDQLGVWIPSKKAFLCGDDVYRAFPNLYAIRGTPTRDVLFWARSLDKILQYEPDYLVPSHSRPLEGKEYIKSILTIYRDSIRLVHDQTVRYMNKGMFPDDIVAKVKLPKHMAEHPFVKPFYGNVEWSVRSIFDRYVGWFSGNIVELSKHTTTEKAKRVIDLAEGVSQMIRKAKKALNERDYKWSLELSSYILAVDSSDQAAKKIRVDSIKALASQQVSANGRNYYLSVALEDYGLVNSRADEFIKKGAIKKMSPKMVFSIFPTILKAEAAEGVDKILVFNLTDVGEVYSLHLNNSVIHVREGLMEGWDVKVTVPFDTWKGVMTKEMSPLMLYATGGLRLDGGLLLFKEIMSYLESD